MPDPKPPDFSQWTPTFEASLWHDLVKSKLHVLPVEPDDSKSVLWVGYINEYQDKTGLAAGYEYDIFGRGVLVKFWGLEKDERDRFSSGAVFYQGNWQYYNLLEYTVIVAVVKTDDDPPDLPFSAAVILVKDLNTEVKITELIIPK